MLPHEKAIRPARERKFPLGLMLLFLHKRFFELIWKRTIVVLQRRLKIPFWTSCFRVRMLVRIALETSSNKMESIHDYSSSKNFLKTTTFVLFVLSWVAARLKKLDPSGGSIYLTATILQFLTHLDIVDVWWSSSKESQCGLLWQQVLYNSSKTQFSVRYANQNFGNTIVRIGSQKNRIYA